MLLFLEETANAGGGIGSLVSMLPMLLILVALFSALLPMLRKLKLVPKQMDPKIRW